MFNHNKVINWRYRTLTIITGVLTGITALSGCLLASSFASADDSAGMSLQLTVPATCGLSIAQDTLSATIDHEDYGTIGTSTITSICNDPAGLAVYATGFSNDTYGNNNLIQTIGNNTYTIASHATASGTPSASEWHMTLAPVTGDFAPEIVSGFSSAHAVPGEYTKVAYRNAMTDIGEEAIGAKFTATFGAYIDSTQAAGTYTGKVKFLLVHPNVLTWQEDSEHPGTMIPDDVQPATLPGLCTDTATCMQTATACDTTLTDARDGKTYTVATINNQCWMTQNLAITGTISAEYSNFSGSDFNVSQYDLTNSTNCIGSGASASDPKGYTNVCSHLDSTGNQYTGNKPTAWYNYAAATAGSITGYSNSTAASSDICPSGWRLPTDTEQSGITSLKTNFSPVYGGNYDNGSLYSAANYGCWWSATAGNVRSRYSLFYSGGSLGTSSYGSRYYGFYVRCVRSS